MSKFIVWKDALLEEWMSCPQDEVTQKLLDTLAHEKITVHTVIAEHALEAIAQIKNKHEQSVSSHTLGQRKH